MWYILHEFFDYLSSNADVLVAKHQVFINVDTDCTAIWRDRVVALYTTYEFDVCSSQEMQLPNKQYNLSSPACDLKV